MKKTKAADVSGTLLKAVRRADDQQLSKLLEEVCEWIPIDQRDNVQEACARVPLSLVTAVAPASRPLRFFLETMLGFLYVNEICLLSVLNSAWQRGVRFSAWTHVVTDPRHEYHEISNDFGDEDEHIRGVWAALSRRPFRLNRSIRVFSNRNEHAFGILQDFLTPSLTHLTARTNSNQHKVLAQWTRLTHLDLNNCWLSEDFIEQLKSLSQLRHLSLFGLRFGAGENFVQQIAQSCPLLEALSIAGSGVAKQLGFLAQLPRLQALDLSHTHPDASEWIHLQSLLHLKELRVRNTKITRESLGLLCHLPLEMLDLSQNGLRSRDLGVLLPFLKDTLWSLELGPDDHPDPYEILRQNPSWGDHELCMELAKPITEVAPGVYDDDLWSLLQSLSLLRELRTGELQSDFLSCVSAGVLPHLRIWLSYDDEDDPPATARQRWPDIIRKAETIQSRFSPLPY